MRHFYRRLLLTLSIFFLMFLFPVFSQETKEETHTVSGYVTDASTGESSIGATVFIKELMKGEATNVYGFYSITVPKGTYNIVVSYVGFQKYEKEIVLDKDLRLNVELQPESIEMEAVEVSATKSNTNVTSTSVGEVKLNIEEIKKIPAFMGEVDVLKTAQLLPGVKSAGEGNTGFYVRGGGPDQNLILLDEAVVYNPSHLTGFFSVFNGDAVKSMTLTKGGMPAKYGGRMASVLDISMKEGNDKTYHVDGGLGVIASRLTVQGPIKKDKSSFIVSGRRSYMDLAARPFAKEGSAAKDMGLYFFDLNAKVNYRISDKDRVFLSGYFGRDVMEFKDPDSGFNFGMDWGNATGVLRWNHLFSDKLFMNVSGIFSDYQSTVKMAQTGFELEVYSGVRDWNAKVDFSYFPSIKHKINYGANYVFHTFTPTSALGKAGETELDFGAVVKDRSHEAAAYVSDDFLLNDRIKAHLGLRYSYFQQFGPFDRYLKDPVNGLTTGVQHYDKNEKVQEYGGLEPRANVNFEINSKSSIKASFTRNYQYIHLASLSAISLPTDIWVPSSQRVKPQIGTQYSLGYFRNFLEDKYETSVEVYYKDLENQIEYKDGTLPFTEIKDNADNNFTFGRGWAYGSEFFIKKRVGKFNGWIGYTLSYTKRQFEDLNLGEEFYAKYDRRHDLSVVLIYDINERWAVSAIGVYGTGNAISVPVAYYFSDVNFVTEYGPRNSFRMPAYHRVDVSVTYTPDREKRIALKKQRLTTNYKRLGKDPSTIVVPKRWGKNYTNSWTFSVYNVYNRHNPFLVYYTAEGNILTGNYKAKAKQMSLLPVIPSITWNFKF